LSRLDQVRQKKLKEKLKTYGEQARLSRQLATIRTDVPISIELKDFILPPPDSKSLREIFKELEFNKLLKELPEANQSEEKDYRLITEWDTFEALLKDLKEQKTFSIDLETTSQYPMSAELVE
jgi:DNA polymerase-1